MLLLNYECLEGREMCIMFCLETTCFSPGKWMTAFITFHFALPDKALRGDMFYCHWRQHGFLGGPSNVLEGRCNMNASICIWMLRRHFKIYERLGWFLDTEHHDRPLNKPESQRDANKDGRVPPPPALFKFSATSLESWQGASLRNCEAASVQSGAPEKLADQNWSLKAWLAFRTTRRGSVKSDRQNMSREETGVVVRHGDVTLQLVSLLTCNIWLNASVLVQSDGRHRNPKFIPSLSKL